MKSSLWRKLIVVVMLAAIPLLGDSLLHSTLPGAPVSPPEANAQLRVRLSGNVKLRRYQIAIPNFTGDAALGAKVASVIRNDLDLTGRFRVIPPKSYLETAPKNGIEPNTFDFEPWSKVSAEGLLKGNVKVVGSRLLLQFRFYEVGTKKLALKAVYPVPSRRSLRWYIHLFCERLYRFLTKERGIFTTKIAFIRRHAGKQELWVMDFDGHAPRRLTNNGSINVLPSWSKNKRYIAFTSWKKRNPDLYRLDLNRGTTRKLSSFRGLNTGAAWSPDSRKIAFSASRGKANMDIYVMNADGSGVRRLTNTKYARNLSPTWSPDGKKIAFVSTRFGSPQVLVMNADGSGVKRLTYKGNYNQSPKWSPRGDWILFTGRDERARFDIFLVSPKTLKVKRLTQNQGNNKEADWSPNGRNIVFSSTRSGASKLWVMTAEGKNARRLTFMPGKFETPTWSPPFAY